MPYTLRIFKDADRTEWDDTAHETMADAYGVLFTNPAPYGDDNIPEPTGVFIKWGWLIAGPSGNAEDPNNPGADNDTMVLTGSLPDYCNKPL